MLEKIFNLKVSNSGVAKEYSLCIRVIPALFYKQYVRRLEKQWSLCKPKIKLSNTQRDQAMDALNNLKQLVNNLETPTNIDVILAHNDMTRFYVQCCGITLLVGICCYAIYTLSIYLALSLRLTTH